MALQVIGAGMGRTGTLSLKAALEQLGFGPCYHMTRIFEHIEHGPMWQQFAAGARDDWDSLLGDFRAAVDWPASHFWRELAAFYPQAKVILTVRDAARWFNSIDSTLFRFMAAPGMPDDEAARRQIVMARDIVQQRIFADRIGDRAHVIEVFERHNRAVQDALPAERLLVYDVAQGWAPLCAFLGVPVPDAPFPRINAQQELLDTHAQRYQIT
ncbi:MAG: sulfotransferase family protein [Immundisolibacter sp.]|uniref:sulfotransferase family protein n=1 Tax=Immundisolibacter sp. TaxID=1934948 RepID=UPI00198817FD|nr:sulfotransferase family protein [Immundisolibacter sp.]MBC7160565.1 sulfotransferase family protein [Immundisolibacter sp.]